MARNKVFDYLFKKPESDHKYLINVAERLLNERHARRIRLETPICRIITKMNKDMRRRNHKKGNQ